MVDLTATRENCLVKVREGCQGVSARATDVSIDSAKLDAFAAEIPTDEVIQGYTGDIQPFPLKFDSVDQEIDFHCLLQMLNFGSAYERHLTERTAYETLQYGMLGLMLSGRKLNVQTLCSLSLNDIAQTFGITLRAERPIKPDSPIYTEADTEVAPFGRMIQKALEDTGRRLRELDCEDFAQFFRKFLDDKNPTASALVFVLQKHLPVFCDGYAAPDSEVLVLHKAQALAAELHRRFSFRVPLFDFLDLERLSTPMDNAIPTLLQHQGVLQYSPALAKKVANAEPVTGNLETELRCVAVHACQQLAQKSGVTCAALYFWLKNQTALESFADVPRFITPESLHF